MTQIDNPPDKTKKATAKPRRRLPSRKERERRAILLSFLAGGATVGLSLLGYVPIINAKGLRLRPPGALEEKEFLASCIKCGQCVQVCPVEAIFLADITDGFGIGVPYLDARKQACDFSCDAVQCVLACPTGALSHHIDKKEQVRMGFARLDKPNLCLARQGKGFKGIARGADFEGLHRYTKVDRWTPIKIADYKYDLPLCDLCVRECPVKNAISMEPMSDDPKDKRRTPKVHEACVGCGMCEMICPVEPAAIVIDERETYKSAHKGGRTS
jgi:ferredoxin-type protein NapG